MRSFHAEVDESVTIQCVYFLYAEGNKNEVYFAVLTGENYNELEEELYGTPCTKWQVDR